MKRLQFLFKDATQKTRIVGIVALALAAVALLTLILSANSAINGSLMKLPIIQFAMEEDDLEDLEEKYSDLLEELDEAIEDEDEDKIEEFEDEYDTDIEEVRDLLEPLSLNSVKELYSIFEDEYNEDEVEAVTTLFSIIITVISIYAAIIGLFLVLSAIFMNRALFIVSAVVSALFFFVLVGAVWFFVYLALCIAYCVLVSQVHTEYKNKQTAAQFGMN